MVKKILLVNATLAFLDLGKLVDLYNDTSSQQLGTTPV